MPEVMYNLVSDVRKNRFSSIPKLSEEDIISVWDILSEFVEHQMLSKKGVHIPQLGTFTFIQKKMDIGNNKFILIQRPVFSLSEKFAQTHALNYTKHHTTGEIPVVPLNFAALAIESPFDRDTVETCVREVLQSLSRAIANQQNVDFLFRGIGVLSIKDCKVKMKFFKEFLNSMDGSGNLVKVLENRPNTADSVMSTRTTLSAHHRPGTQTLTLPKLNGGKNLLPSIDEYDQHEIDKEDGDKVSLPPTRSVNREVIHPHSVVGVSLSPDELKEPLPCEENVAEFCAKKISNPTNKHDIKPPSTASSEGKFDVNQNHESGVDITQPVSDEELRAVSAPVKPLLVPSPPVTSSRRASRSDITVCLSPKHHHKSGQELCYLCMQRSMRNIPVSFDAERKRKEKEQDALLQQYQQMKDQEAIFLEQANKNSMRQSNQKVAAFNLGVAECLRDAKNKRSSEFAKSYVFQNRPLTPLRFYKQEEYNKALETQVRLRSTRESREKYDREFQERLEQVQLAEDLAAERERFLRVKADQMSQYQRALSAQIRSKPAPLPKSEADSKGPIFGRFDATNEKLRDQKERARALLKSQLEVVTEKKKSSILHHLAKQREENDMLERTKQELISDRIGAYQRSHGMRRSLEENWKNHHLSKMQREELERTRLQTPGMLLFQRNEGYRRCGQCERRVNNCGESNIWSESRYIPGSRLMV